MTMKINGNPSKEDRRVMEVYRAMVGVHVGDVVQVLFAEGSAKYFEGLHGRIGRVYSGPHEFGSSTDVFWDVILEGSDRSSAIFERYLYPIQDD